MNEYDPIKNLTSSPDWISIEQELELYLSEMFDLRKVDTTLSAVAYKTECVARLRAAQNVLKFYERHKFLKKEVNNTSFSFK
jgi:hypothetical protein